MCAAWVTCERVLDSTCQLLLVAERHLACKKFRRPFGLVRDRQRGPWQCQWVNMPWLCGHDVINCSDIFQRKGEYCLGKKSRFHLAILSHTVCSTRAGACVSVNGSRTSFKASEMLRKSWFMVTSSSSSAGILTRCLLLVGGDTYERGMRWRWLLWIQTYIDIRSSVRPEARKGCAPCFQQQRALPRKAESLRPLLAETPHRSRVRYKKEVLDSPSE